MVAPDVTTLVVNSGRIFGIDVGTSDAADGGASLPAVEPAVRTPCESVRDAVRVFQPESRKPHFRRPVRDIVPVGVRVEQQVGCVHDPDASPAAQRRVRHVEPLQHVLLPVIESVAVCVLMHADPVRASVVVGGRGRNAIVFGAVVLIPAEHLDAFRIRVLPVLRDPHPTSSIKAHVRGLGDLRFVKQLLDDQVFIGLESRQSIFRRKPSAGDRLHGRIEGCRRKAEVGVRVEGALRLGIDRQQG